MQKEVADVMGRFDSIYPFTTENIAGYISDLDLTDKKVITVTGSTDHILNIVARGGCDITTFDVNPLTEPYMDLKLSAFRSLDFKEFVNFLLYDSKISLNKTIISSLGMSDFSRDFWLDKLREFNNDGRSLKNSKYFNRKYFNPDSKVWQNLYLNEDGYKLVKERLGNVRIQFLNSSLEDLEVDEDFDYMFLSNISDYIEMMYGKNGLVRYRDLMNKFLERVKTIYMAYLYDVGNGTPRSEIDDLDRVDELFKNYEIEKFRSALETTEELQDGVIILRR